MRAALRSAGVPACELQHRLGATRGWDAP